MAALQNGMILGGYDDLSQEEQQKQQLMRCKSFEEAYNLLISQGEWESIAHFMAEELFPLRFDEAQVTDNTEETEENDWFLSKSPLW